MNGDIRNFFGGGGKSGSQSNKSTSQGQKPAATQPSNTSSGQKKSEDKKRKADVFDQGEARVHHDTKRVKRLKDFDDDIDDEVGTIALNLTNRQPKKEPTPQKFMSDELDSFRFGGAQNKRRVQEEEKTSRPKTDMRRTQTSVPGKESFDKINISSRQKEPLRKGKTTMEIENEGSGTDVTEVISEHDEPPSPPIKKTEGKKPSLKELAMKNKMTNKPPVARKSSFDFEDDFDDPPAKGKKSASKTPTKKGGKKEDTTIQGPLSGQTIVITGVLDIMSRDKMTDLLKMLGAKVTGSVSSKTNYLVVGSVLEDGRPPDQSKKYQTAQEKGTTILTESELDDFLYKKTGVRLSDGFDAFITRPSAPVSTGGASGSGQKKTTGTTQAAAPAASTAKKVQIKKRSGEKATELWTKKYAPDDVNDLIGNQGFVNNIINWLKDWHDVVIKGNKKETKFVQGKSKDNWGTSNVNARACLVSGPPGIGKTTAVRLIAKKLGYDIIEQNASDVRNKKSVEGLLNHLTDNSLMCSNRTDLTNHQFLILMDECDGMSAGDRGGNQALINAIKTTKTPIICICNDRQHPKIRSLANHCYDIRFHKPPKQTVAKRIAEIAAEEGLKVDMNSLEYMCESFGNDIRQILNFIQMYSKTSNTLTYIDAKNTIGKTKKDETVMLNNFEAGRRLMTGRDLTIRDKTDLFFIDYDLIPLLVQENYISSTGPATIPELENMARASDIIATGDILNRKIRQHGDWGLMPNFAFMSSIYPCEIMRPNVGFPQFPAWLGKNSSSRKRQREIKELRAMMSPEISGTRLTVLFDYTPALVNLLHYNVTNSRGGDLDVIENIIDVLSHYRIELAVAKEYLPDLQLPTAKIKDPFLDLTTQMKTQLTKTWNSRHKTSITAKKGKKVVGGGDDDATAASGVGHKFNPEADEEEVGGGAESEEEGAEEEDDSIEMKETGKGKGKGRATSASATNRKKKEDSGEKKKREPSSKGTKGKK